MTNPTSFAPVEAKVVSLDNAGVGLVLRAGNNQIAEINFTPKEVAAFASHLLRAAHDSFANTQKPLAPQPAGAKIENPIPTNDLQIGTTPVQGQKVMIFRAGEAPVGFIISDAHLRSLGRSLLAVSWQHQPVETSRRLLAALLVDFFGDLRGWWGVFNARFKAASRRRATSAWSIISGSSFRIFRTIEISPGKSVPKYPAFNGCIYCGSPVYSTKPGGRECPFGAEHIIPEGIGGTVELPEASCQDCEDKTGRLVEGQVLGDTLKALRVHLKLKKAGSGPHPKTLPLMVTEGGKDRKVMIPIEDYPVVFMMVAYTPPSYVADNKETGRAANGVRAAILKVDYIQLRKKYGVTSFASAAWDNQMLCRMLAKIGHAFAVAEIGPNRFRPMLTDFICKGDLAAMSLVGGGPLEEGNASTTALHELAIGYQRASGKTFVMVGIKLFARHGGPQYYAVVGESLESPIARFRRTFSSMISRMLAR